MTSAQVHLEAHFEGNLFVFFLFLYAHEQQKLHDLNMKSALVRVQELLPSLENYWDF